MLTSIKTIHEEQQLHEDNKNIGVLLNYNNNMSWSETLFFLYKNEMYIFFETITELIDYTIYGLGDKGIKRAYVKEHVFDAFYDSSGQIEGSFKDNIMWGI
jgi:hypothetical protein